MKNKNLIIISNEKVSKDSFFYCDNIDMKTIPEDLSNFFNVTLIARDSKIKRSRKINIDKIQRSLSIFGYIYNILKTLKKQNTIYFIVSITPYTFLSYFFLFIFRKKIYVYLRSNGYEEYKAILGFIGPLIYYIMFKTVTFKSKIITCDERLFEKDKSNIVYPSEISQLWIDDLKKPNLSKINLLYVGRVKIEKGIFSLIEILNEIRADFELTIVGKNEKAKISNSKINFIGGGYNAHDLIKIYDNHNISILPSFTEAHPKVIDESLARMRPVIIFEEIIHVIRDKKGIFVCKRDPQSLLETINFIIKNYSNIQDDMVTNKLPTKKNFILKLGNILDMN